MTTNQKYIKLPKPTEEQRAILKSKSQCRLVISVPGSGKTTLLLQAIQQHITGNKGHCLMLTFSKKSDSDNAKKVGEFFGESDYIDIRTFDSFCYKVVMDNWIQAGYSKKPKFDNDFQVELLQKVYDSIKRQSVRDKLPYKAVFDVLVKQNTTEAKLIKNLKQYKKGIYYKYYEGFNNIKKRYSKFKKRESIIDFDSQVKGCYQVLKNNPEVLQDIASTFPLILIDEVQDLSPTQLKIAILLAQHATQSILVGDDAQSIYAFRGVTGNNFVLLSTKVANTVTFNMTQTHRCSKQVALLASMIRGNINGISHLEMRSEKDGDKPRLVGFNNHDAQYNWVADYIVTLHDQGIGYPDIAIVSRKHESLAQVQRKLQVRDIRFNSKYYTGQEGLAEELDTVVNLLRLMHQPDDETILSLFVFYGIASIQEHYDYIYEELKSKKVKANETEVKALRSLGIFIRKSLNKESLEAKTNLILQLLISKLKGKFKYYLKSHLSYYSMRSRQLSAKNFIGEIVAHAETISDPDYVYSDSVSLLTAHSAKGLEFKVVFIIDADHSMFPYVHSKKHSDNPNDELKLFYVAVTRCSQSLILSSVNNKSTDFRPTEFVSGLKGIRGIVDCLMIK